MEEESQEEVKEEKKTSAKKSEKSTFTLTLKSLAFILCLCSLCLTYLFAILLAFGVNLGTGYAIFFLITSLLAIAGMVLAVIDERKLNMTLCFAVFTILVTVIVYF
ncbi:MAG: hypothetical protein IJ837_04665 [Clostridia bacterium]|nr:hypothetical protein [Clostridia bacterium]